LVIDSVSSGHRGSYDGIIIGAGHNALILATYLGQAGARVFPAGYHRHAVVR